MSSSRDDRYYATVGKSRRSPPTGDPQGGVFFQTGQGGRTVLPPLSSAFPTSRFPVPPSYANQYTQPRSSPGKYDYTQFYNPYNTSPQPASSYPTYENSERYSPQPPYGTYPTRASPAIPANPQDSRKLPPLATSPNAGGERWQQSSYIPTSSNYQGGGIRSPTASYPTAYAGYQTSHQTGAYTYHLPTGESMHPHVPSMNTQVHVSGYDTMDPSRPDPRSSSPYSRSSSHVSPPTYTPPPVSPTSADEPTIKKKRKRADAAQLKVLNETYNRTAFPSTEERLALAKALDMSARSVQIWFQNKRQSMRQTNRQSSTTSGSSHQTFSMSTQDPMMEELGHPSTGGYTGMTMTDAYMTRPPQEAPRPHTTQPSSSHRRVRSQDEVIDPRKWSRGY